MIVIPDANEVLASYIDCRGSATKGRFELKDAMKNADGHRITSPLSLARLAAQWAPVANAYTDKALKESDKAYTIDLTRRMLYEGMCVIFEEMDWKPINIDKVYKKLHHVIVDAPAMLLVRAEGKHTENTLVACWEKLYAVYQKARVIKNNHERNKRARQKRKAKESVESGAQEPSPPSSPRLAISAPPSPSPPPLRTASPDPPSPPHAHQAPGLYTKEELVERGDRVALIYEKGVLTRVQYWKDGQEYNLAPAENDTWAVVL